MCDNSAAAATAASDDIGLKFAAATIAFVSTSGCQIGLIFQKKSTQKLPELVFTKDIIKQYVTNKHWLGGLILNVGGGGLGVAALLLAPVSVIQPIFCAGLAVLAIFSHFYLKEHLNWVEWIAVFLNLAGAVCLGVTLEVSTTAPDTVAAGITLGATVLLLIFMEILGNITRTWNNQTLVEMLAGGQGGISIGMGNACFAAASALTIKCKQGWYWMLIGAVCGIVFQASGQFFITRGFKFGRAATIGVYLTLVSLITAIGVGLVVLKEPWPAATWAQILRIVSLIGIAIGVTLLTLGASKNKTPDLPSNESEMQGVKTYQELNESEMQGGKTYQEGVASGEAYAMASVKYNPLEE